MENNVRLGFTKRYAVRLKNTSPETIEKIIVRMNQIEKESLDDSFEVHEVIKKISELYFKNESGNFFSLEEDEGKIVFAYPYYPNYYTSFITENEIRLIIDQIINRLEEVVELRKFKRRMSWFYLWFNLYSYPIVVEIDLLFNPSKELGNQYEVKLRNDK
ncbi:hypothetical protein A2733_01165 [Candidatus Nomurabacteria bacterium RIFCSPHIGHO2_01_FULL_40_20]|uniref:Uncharacterized protein n=1 Tax=Candidatus Nomurabacteria bacterium RIFCSPHIGHO2_01_FULL_40_20 TaxID=1801738 RepID=A0A1F6V4E4_9BACT|nr:MAG: hypothetical protein A2733_01165 [Candidatus Nomurabacteria bacterium RIFCSPHIGHO2_01_FULL_40_20]